MELTEGFYKLFGGILANLCKELKISVFSVLEGGYSTGLRYGLPAFLKGFEEEAVEDVEKLAKTLKPSIVTKSIVENIIKIHKGYGYIR